VEGVWSYDMKKNLKDIIHDREITRLPNNELLGIHYESWEVEQKVQHKASDILINATEAQCSGIRHQEVNGEKQYCALGLLNLYSQ